MSGALSQQQRQQRQLPTSGRTERNRQQRSKQQRALEAQYKIASGPKERSCQKHSKQQKALLQQVLSISILRACGTASIAVRTRLLPKILQKPGQLDVADAIMVKCIGHFPPLYASIIKLSTPKWVRPIPQAVFKEYN